MPASGTLKGSSTCLRRSCALTLLRAAFSASSKEIGSLSLGSSLMTPLILTSFKLSIADLVGASSAGITILLNQL